MRKHHFKLSVIICAVDETGSLERRVATETFDVERRPRARLKAELGVLPVLLLNDENAKVKNGLIRPQARTISWSRPNYDDDSCGSVAVDEWTGFQILTTWWWWSLGCLRLGLECNLRLLIRLLNDLADSDRYFRLGVWREEEASHFFFEKLCQWFIAEIRQLYGMKFATLLWFVRLIRRIFVRTMHRQVCVPLVTPRNAHWPQRSAAWLIADRYRHAGKRSR